MQVHDLDIELVNNFVKSYENEGTRETYFNITNYYLIHLQKKGVSISQSRQSDILSFLYDRPTRLADTTLNTYLDSIKSLYQFGVQANYIANNPAKKISLRAPKVMSATIADETYNIVKNLLRSLESESLAMSRDRALVSVVFYCTMKISEALNLKRGDLEEHRDKYFLKVQTLNAGSRTIPVHDHAVQSLLHYLSLLPKLDSTDFLFVTIEGRSGRIKQGQKFARQPANTRLRKHRVKTGQETWLSYEKIRQAGILQMIANGAELDVLQHYTGLSIMALRRFMPAKKMDVDVLHSSTQYFESKK